MQSLIIFCQAQLHTTNKKNKKERKNGKWKWKEIKNEAIARVMEPGQSIWRKILHVE